MLNPILNVSTNPMSTDHLACFTDECDCTCAGCTPKECRTCPKCGADIDPTPADGGVTDPHDSPSYRDFPTYTGPAQIGSWRD